MDANFDLRRKIFGDTALGWANLDMVELVRIQGGKEFTDIITETGSMLRLVSLESHHFGHTNASTLTIPDKAPSCFI